MDINEFIEKFQERLDMDINYYKDQRDLLSEYEKGILNGLRDAKNIIKEATYPKKPFWL